MSDTAATTDQIEVIPVTGSIGAEIAGVQLRALDDATFAVIRRSLYAGIPRSASDHRRT